MGLFRGQKVKAKLVLASVLSSGTALFVVGAVMTRNDLEELRQALIQRMSIQAEIVSTNCVSNLLFNDSLSAETTLGALKADPRILSASLYDADRRLFASYRRDPSVESDLDEQSLSEARDGHRLSNDKLTFTRRVFFEGKPIGTAVIVSDLSEVSVAMTRRVVLSVSVLLASMVIALLISSRLQRDISQPIQHLAETARRVSQGKDYSVRASGQRSDEIGALITAFNEMLEEIRKQEADLRAAHDRLEERVTERTAQLQAVNNELEAFSYSVSHDLRAPVRHIAGFAEMLEQERDGFSDAGRRYLQKISEAATRMGQLIDDLLVFSRMGRSEMHAGPVNLAELVAAVVKEAQPDVTRPIEWRVGPLPTVHGDPAMLRQVLGNLISNAIKYTGKNKSPRIEVGVASNGGREVVVCVRDNGVGFDMAYAPKLFGVFQRLHRADEFDGTGIGLANVRRIIQRHGGRTWAEGKPGQGAAFYFSLPRESETRL